jgi:hypothetical protein
MPEIRRLTPHPSAAALVAALLLWAPAPAPAAEAPAGSKPEAAQPPAEPDEHEPLRADLESLRGAIASLTGGLVFSGFLAMRAESYSASPNVFGLGLELDLAKAAGPQAQFAGAVTFDEKSAALAVGFVDLHFLGGMVSPRGALWPERGFHLQAGRFDLPFGDDWRYYAPSGRAQIGLPLTTAAVLAGGLNDIGVRAYGSAAWLNYAAWLIRGYGKGNALGARLEVAPLDTPFTLRASERNRFELALSALYDLDDHGALERWVVAVDFDGRAGPLHLRGEAMERRDADHTLLFAWQVTAEGDLAAALDWPLVLYARYDALFLQLPEAAGFNRQQRLAAGARYLARQAAAIKAECTASLDAGPAIRARDDFSGTACRAMLVVSF